MLLKPSRPRGLHHKIQFYQLPRQRPRQRPRQSTRAPSWPGPSGICAQQECSQCHHSHHQLLRRKRSSQPPTQPKTVRNQLQPHTSPTPCPEDEAMGVPPGPEEEEEEQPSEYDVWYSNTFINPILNLSIGNFLGTTVFVILLIPPGLWGSCRRRAFGQGFWQQGQCSKSVFFTRCIAEALPPTSCHSNFGS